MKGIIFVMIAALLWALDTLIRYPLIFSRKSAELIVFGEHLFLTLLFVPVLYGARKKFKNIGLSHLFYFVIVGGLGSAMATIAFTKAFGLINPSLVILLQKLQPVVAIVLAHFVLKERMKSEFFIWFLIAIAGGWLISYQDLSGGVDILREGRIDFSLKSVKGYALTLLAVVSWGSATIFGKLLGKKGYDEKEIMAGRFAMGLIWLLPFLLSFNLNFMQPGLFWPKVFGLAFISGVVGMYFYYKGLKLIPAHLCTLAEMFFPFFAVAVNWIFLGKDLSMMQISGAILLLISSTMIQLRHL